MPRQGYRKFTKEMIATIIASPSTIKQLAEEYRTAQSVIWKMKRGKYGFKEYYVYKPFGDINRMKEIVTQEYIKIKHKEPDKVAVHKFAEYHQFVILPERIFFQLSAENLTNETLFTRMVSRNIANFGNNES